MSDQLVIQQLTNDLVDCNKARAVSDGRVRMLQDVTTHQEADLALARQQLRGAQAANDKLTRETLRLRVAMIDCGRNWVPPTEVLTDNYAAVMLELGRRTQVLLQALSVVD